MEEMPFFEKGDTAWFANAACTPSNTLEAIQKIRVFFPEQRGKNTNEAKKICRDCTVSEECYSYALNNRITDGVWGGVTMSMRPSRRSKLIR